MPIRHRRFGGMQGAPSAVRRGWAAGRSPGGKRSAQPNRGEGVSNESPQGRDAPSTRCAARQRGPAEPETHGIVNPHRCLCCNPWTRDPAFSHRRKVADQHRPEIGSTTKHKRRTAPSHIFVRRESPSSEAASNDPGFSCSTAHGSMVPTKTMHSRVGSIARSPGERRFQPGHRD